ncbi:MAG: acylphosphatase [Candidatus Brachytrichaceae bacterium NZ_4S206]|jgi:acylphosphatase
MEDRTRLHAIVRGIVQGVNFRYYTRREAQRLLLTGWVRNRPDGAVEVVAEGPRVQLDRLLDFLHTGPPMAHVTGVEATWQPATGEFTAFEIRG